MGVKQLVVQDALLTILSELSYVVVHTHHKHGGISRRGRDDDPFGSTLQVGPGLLHGSDDASRLHDTLSISITLFDGSGISLLEDGDGLPIDDKCSGYSWLST